MIKRNKDKIVRLNRQMDMLCQLIDDYQNEAEEIEKEMKKLGVKYEPYNY